MRKLLLIACLLFLSASIVQAQDNLAAPIEITYEGLRIQQNGTEQWIALPDGAITAFGSQDTIQTDEVGRGIITFGDYGTILILPNSEFELQVFHIEDEQIYLEANMLGTFLLQFNDLVNIHLNTPDVELVEITGNVGLWASHSQADVILVENGFVTLNFNERTGTIGAGEGWRYHPDDFQLTRLDEPFNRARLIGILDGCAGLIRTQEGNRGVIVRTGPGQGFQRRGLIEDNQQAPLLAQTETTGWTRIQYANAFGWVVSAAVTSNCDLQSLPDDSPEEETLRAINADERELAMLRPFFGIVGLDGFFYQFIEED